MCKEEPTPSALRDLLGVSLFEVWQGFRSAIEAAYEMEQIGDRAERIGGMNTNTAEAGRRSAACMRGKTALAFW